MKKITKLKLVLLTTITIALVTSFMIYHIDSSAKRIIENKKIMLLNEAKALFNNMVMIRLWNSIHGGVYVKETKNTKPNPYLPDNVMKNDKGENFVKVNPAWMTKQISQITNSRSKYYFKITSLDPINPSNKADDFETQGLKYFEKNRDKKYYYKLSIEDNKFDFIGKLNTEPECLQCHAVHNYKVGDIRGGIRVSIPISGVAESIEIINNETMNFIFLLIILAFIIWAIVYYLIGKIFQQHKALEDINSTLEDRVQEEVAKNLQKEIQLSNQSKLVAMGEMIGNIAHQWRQPLSVISSGATGLKMQRSYGVMTDENFENILNSINDNAQYLSQTIDDFKNFIRGDKSAVDFLLKNNTDSFIKIVDSSIKNHHIHLILELEENINLHGYPNELIQCFINIFNNSKDAFNDNGIKEDDRFVFIRQHIKEEFVIIEFKDSAGGIIEDVLDKIFDAYFTTKNDSRGTGLGLHMTKDIITNMGGTIKASNEEYTYMDKQYKGAKFRITLPL